MKKLELEQYVSPEVTEFALNIELSVMSNINDGTEGYEDIG